MELKDGEIIKDIPGYEGLYAATTHGRIWSYPSLDNQNRKGLFLKPAKHGKNKNYLSVVLRKKEKTSKQVHRLVALTFLLNPENKPQINHKDNIGSNNYIDNLEWVTNLENRRHAMINGLPRVSPKSREVAKIVCAKNNKLKRKLSYDNALKIKEDRILKGSSTSFLAKKYNTNMWTIRRIINGESYLIP